MQGKNRVQKKKKESGASHQENEAKTHFNMKLCPPVSAFWMLVVVIKSNVNRFMYWIEAQRRK